MKKYVLIPLIVGQVIIIFFLGKQIYVDRINTLGISVNIQNEGVGSGSGQNPNSTLKYFYEPEANTVFDEKFPWEPSKKITTSINSDTLHNIEIIISSKPNIVALGDSFTYGEFVKRTNNWVSLLNTQMDAWKEMRVVNFGVEGYDIEYAVERFRIRGAKYDPQLVIWFLKGDDFISINERLTPLIKEEKKIFEKTEMSNPADLVIAKKGQEVPIYIKRAVDKYTKSFGGITQVYTYQDKKMRSLRDYYKGPILIMYLDIKDEHLKMLNKWKEDDSQVYLFKVPELDPDMLFPDTHPNEKGHQKIAAELLMFLKDNENFLKQE